VEDLYDQSVRWIPRQPTLENFRLVWVHMEYVRSFLNSFALAFTTSILQVAVCTMVGYGLARLPFRGSGLIFSMALFTLIVPPQVVITPTYLNFRFFNIMGLLGENSINLIGTYWPFVL